MRIEFYQHLTSQRPIEAVKAIRSTLAAGLLMIDGETVAEYDHVRGQWTRLGLEKSYRFARIRIESDPLNGSH